MAAGKQRSIRSTVHVIIMIVINTGGTVHKIISTHLTLTHMNTVFFLSRIFVKRIYTK